MTSAQPGIAVSAKGQLVAAAAGHAPLEQGVAGTIPAIGPPEPLAGEATTVLPGSDAPGPGAADPIDMAALPPSEPEPQAPVAASNGVVPQPPPVAPRSSAVAGAATIAHAAAAATSEPAVSDEVIPAARLARALGPIGLVPPDMAVRRAPTWLRNAVAPVIDDRPAIAIVIDDLGANRAGTAALNRLPAPLTLAFLPYAQGLEQQTRAARAAGHELMVHVPMEPTGNAWPGPNALLASLPPADLVSRLRSQLRSFRGFVGINN
ncbi:MAG: divergent polysaccharide deacetylase family protein, partial [Geminicoccaceae bacterium]